MGIGVRLVQQALAGDQPPAAEDKTREMAVALLPIVKAIVTKSAADQVAGGKADKQPDSKYSPKQLAIGKKVEREHTDNPAMAKEIAKDHLEEFGNYYTELQKMEHKLDKSSGWLVHKALKG